MTEASRSSLPQTSLTPRIRRRLRIGGIVQGVGLRPFVYRLATRLRLSGSITNDTHGVAVEIEGDEGDVQEFLDRLRREVPPLARIGTIEVAPLPPLGTTGFVIADSTTGGAPATLISPDIAACEDCLREIFDPADRRYSYPFTNCVNCGPRFTIVRDVPYDRPRTTMAGFALCAACAREYEDPRDRRFHAQPICCPACGPRLRLLARDGTAVDGDALRDAASRLRSGHVVAVKGLGGYHLAALAADPSAVSALRSRKRREDRPFAVMARDLDEARRIADFDADEAALLASPCRPIVLLRRRSSAPLAEAVAPGNRFVGVMLAYTPLHHLLSRHTAQPIVLTSGNLSDEPIAYADDDALQRLRGIADFFLVHDRPIHVRADDSVARVFRGRPLAIRRSRGSAPEPLALPWTARRPILACGAELKSTFCLAKGAEAFLSQHIGDLENFDTWQSYREAIDHYRRLFDVEPAVVAHDLHPEYLSTKLALELPAVDRIGVQHHHAHIASCLAENGVAGPAIGVAFDGLGYGMDGTLWGGEFLLAGLDSFQRLAHFAAVPMPGGSAAIRQPWRMSAVYLDSLRDEAVTELDVARRNATHWAGVLALAHKGVQAPLTSSVGRLFDAVAAILGVRDAVNYEGQAAAELEQLADRSRRGGYRAGWDGSEKPYRVRGTDMIRGIVEDLRAGVAPAQMAARFHDGLATTVVEMCDRLRDDTGISLVALSGGVFQNLLLLQRTVEGLEARGFRVLTHSRVPPNDGGISFGQAIVAGARDRCSDPSAFAAGNPT
jgi:hydrogenase maturation protein HypF